MVDDARACKPSRETTHRKDGTPQTQIDRRSVSTLLMGLQCTVCSYDTRESTFSAVSLRPSATWDFEATMNVTIGSLLCRPLNDGFGAEYVVTQVCRV